MYLWQLHTKLWDQLGSSIYKIPGVKLHKHSAIFLTYYSWNLFPVSCYYCPTWMLFKIVAAYRRIWSCLARSFKFVYYRSVNFVFMHVWGFPSLPWVGIKLDFWCWWTWLRRDMMTSIMQIALRKRAVSSYDNFREEDSRMEDGRSIEGCCIKYRTSPYII